MMTKTPNFAGWRVLVLGEEDANIERLRRQLGLLRMTVEVRWAAAAIDDLPELVVIDADRGWDDVLPWTHEAPARPVVALLGSEAPARLAWAMRQGASSVIAKPVTASAIYPALVLGVAMFEERREAARRIALLEERLKLRPIVFAALTRLKSERQLDDERAYAMLRDCAMRRRMPIEQIAADYLTGSEMLQEAG